MKMSERMKKALSFLLCVLMLVQYVPTTAFAATTAEDGLCEHHTEHTAECGYVEGEGGCAYHCDICLEQDQAEETTEATEPAPVCDCGTDDPAFHATNCPAYEASENPECFCAGKCVEPNVWCEICGFDYTKCGGSDNAAVYADGWYTVSGNTVTIDGTLGGKTTATEDDVNTLVEAIKGYVDIGITTIIVTGSKPAMIDMGSWTNTAIGEAIYRLSGSGYYDENNPYNGKIDLILSNVTEIVEMEFYGAFALNSITLPVVTKLGDLAFFNTRFLRTITFGSVLTEVNETNGGMFAWIGKNVGNCDLILNCGQMNSTYIPNLTTNIWHFKHDNEFKSITLTHTEGTAATCSAQATCSVCGDSYGVVDADAHSYGDWVSNGDFAHIRTCANDSTHTERDYCSGGTATCASKAVCEVCQQEYGRISATNHDSAVSFDANGFCPNGCYEPATGSGTATEPYQIGNAGQLYWFAYQVNHGKTPANAILTDNIEVNKNVLVDGELASDTSGFRTWTPIGNYIGSLLNSKSNIGTFDGQNYTVSGLYYNNSETNYVGLFGYVQGGTVKNVGVVNSYFKGKKHVGGVMGYCFLGIVTNCYNTGNVTGSDDDVGGVVGYCLDGIVTNCYNTGPVKGSDDDVGGVVGYSSGTVMNCYNTGNVTGSGDDVGGVVGCSSDTVMNCYNLGTVTGSYRYVGGVIGCNNNSSIVINCYYLTGCAKDGSETTQKGIGQAAQGSTTPDYRRETTGKTSDQFASGEVAWLLQNGVEPVNGTVPHVWGQTIDKDTSPVLGGEKVYAVINCKNEAVSYNNTEGKTLPHDWSNKDGICKTCGATCDHGGEEPTYTNGFCTVCGGYQPAKFIDDNGTPDKPADDHYEVSNAGQLFWFAEQMNVAFWNELEIKLTADIDLENREWTPIGINSGDYVNQRHYVGHFDGQNHSINNFKMTITSGGDYGLFCIITSGAVVENFSISGNVTINTAEQVNYGVVCNPSKSTVRNVHSSIDLKVENGSNKNKIGGIVGYVPSNYCPVTVDRCSFNGTMDLGSNPVDILGGIVAYVEANGEVTITNCGFYGKLNSTRTDGANQIGGIMGYYRGTGLTLQNCLSVGTINASNSAYSGMIMGRLFEHSSANTKVTNNYYTGTQPFGDNSDSRSIVKGYGNQVVAYSATQVTTEQLASGEVAYRLNKGVSDGTQAWYQTLTGEGKQNEPRLSGGTVYRGGTCAATTYNNTGTDYSDHPDYNENGFCTVCGNGYEPATLNGTVYQIENVGQLYWFAEFVNSGNKSANAILMADLDLEGRLWTAICPTDLYYDTTTYADKGYAGTFDGNNHVIKNISLKGASGQKKSVGLIGTLSGTVKNLGIETLTFDLNGATDIRAGAVVGQIIGGKVSDCYVKNATINPGTYVTGGIAACNYAGLIENCYVVGSTISGTEDRFGYIVGDNRGDISTSDRKGTVQNCYTDASAYFGGRTGTETNCEANVTAARFASGEIAYKLGTAWGQTIEQDAYPVLRGEKVYAVTNCKGETASYSNTEGETLPHDWENGTCSVCRATCAHAEYDNGFCKACDAYQSATLNGGVYKISNAGQLYWFAALVNGGNTSVKAELTANIVVNEGVMTANSTGVRAWTPIGNSSSKYNGTFDGQNYTVSGLYFNNSETNYVGLFGYLDGSGKVQNVGVVDSYFCGKYYVGGVVGSIIWLGTVENSYNTGTVSGRSYVGGVAGRNEGIVENSYNTGSVSGNSEVGGVAGYCHTGFVRNCYNTGAVTSGEDAGGVVGYNNGTVTNCYNTGSVSGKNGVGGVVGGNFSIVRNCYNTGSVSGNSKVGGVAGSRTAGTITNCYYLDTVYTGGINGTDAEGSAEARNVDAFKNGEVAYRLQGEQTDHIWGQKIGTDDYPVLRGDKVYAVTNCKGETASYSNTEGVTLDHEYGTLIPVQPEVHTQTELKAGVVAHYQCSVCQKYFTENKAETTLEDLTGETPEHNYSDATCEAPATCSECQATTGSALGHKDDDKNHVCDNGCGIYQGEHKDSATDNDHICDYCKNESDVLEACSDKTGDNDHNCDVCGKENVSEHDYGDATCEAPATCSECPATTGSALGHKDENKDHACDNGCEVYQGEHKDSATDDDHICDYCKNESDVLEACSDKTGDDNHNCDICGKQNVSQHSYGDWINTNVEKHWKECECGMKSEEADHTYGTDHRCVCGAEDPNYDPDKTYVAQIGETKYESLADAVNAVAKGTTANATTITLLDDVKVTNQFVGKSYAQNIILDLGGHTLSSSDKALTVYRAGTTLTITNGTVSGCTTGGSVCVTYGGHLILGDNVTIAATGGSDKSTAILVDNGKLTVAAENVKVTSKAYAIREVANDNNKIELSSGTYSSDVGSEWCAEGYVPSQLDDGTWTVTKNWYDPDATEYYIHDVKDLQAFADAANAGDNFSGKTVYLKANIDLGEATWTPIASFAGEFDGGEYTISNFHIDCTSSSGGFFGTIGAGANVHDLTLSNVTATVGNNGSKSGYRFGTLANGVQGIVNGVTVKNVTVTTTGTNAWVGGMCAFMNYSSMKDCTVENLTVNAEAGADLIGGFACILQKNSPAFDNNNVNGFKVTVNDTDPSSCGVGGFVCQTQRGWEHPIITNSKITGIDVTASGLVDVGGFIAWPGAHTTATNCSTEGKIDVTGVTSADYFAGGFFGNLGWNCDLGQMGHVVTGCSADVSITTTVAPAGGFVGSATNSNNNSMYATFNNCSASGSITCVAGGTADIGGFAGDADRGVYKNCTASGTVTNNGTGKAGQFIGAIYDVTPKYDGRYPAGTRGYLVDEITIEVCTYTGSSELSFIGNTAEGADVTVIKFEST